MKRALLLIVAAALLVALGFAQTPAASINPDQTIKGCLAGSDGNYTVVEHNTGHILKITGDSIDFKQHLGHDVTLIGHTISGVGSAAADNGFAVTGLNMISEHCATVAAAPTAVVTTPAETAAAPTAVVATPAETAVAPTTASPAPVATTSTAAAEIAITPAVDAPAPAVAPPAATVVTPAVEAVAPAAIVSTPAETVGKPAATAAHPAPMPAHPRKSTTPPAASTTPAATSSPSPEPVRTPDAVATTPTAAAGTSSEPVSNPAAVATPPAAPARRGALWLLIALAVLVIAIGTLVPFLSRWRKRKMLERTDAPNLSFNREASSDQGKSEPHEPRKAA